MFFAAIISCIALVQASIIPVEVHHPQPYKFGYSVKDHHGEQHREESGNGAGGVVGSYGFTDDRGIARQVNYVADHAGFRAQVKTNEPGTANQNPAAVQVISDAPYANVAAAPVVAQTAAVVVPTVVDASPVLDARYAGLGYGAVQGNFVEDAIWGRCQFVSSTFGCRKMAILSQSYEDSGPTLSGASEFI
ncbi:UNVERIFIED_CONTAM: Cuticle protein 16.8 [Trichonephila clavipes]